MARNAVFSMASSFQLVASCSSSRVAVVSPSVSTSRTGSCARATEVISARARRAAATRTVFVNSLTVPMEGGPPARIFGGRKNKRLLEARGTLLSPTMSLTRRVAFVAACAFATRGAYAEPERTSHSIYVEALGKGGLWGLGYGYQLTKRLALGAVASMWMFDGQRVYSASPFLTVYPAGTERHRLFVDVGPQLVRVFTPAPVPELMDTSSTGIGGQVSIGYERRGPLLVRVYAMGVAGENGVAPWLGVDMGAAF